MGQRDQFPSGRLKALCRNPDAPFERDRIDRALRSELIGTDGIWFIGPLTEIDLPGWQSAGPRQSLTSKVKVLHVCRMKDEYERREPCRSYAIGKLSGRVMETPVFLDVQHAKPVLLNGNNIVEGKLDGTRSDSPFVNRLVNYSFGRRELVDIGTKLLDALSRILQDLVEMARNPDLDQRHSFVNIRG